MKTHETCEYFSGRAYKVGRKVMAICDRFQYVWASGCEYCNGYKKSDEL